MVPDYRLVFVTDMRPDPDSNFAKSTVFSAHPRRADRQPNASIRRHPARVTCSHGRVVAYGDLCSSWSPNGRSLLGNRRPFRLCSLLRIENGWCDQRFPRRIRTPKRATAYHQSPSDGATLLAATSRPIGSNVLECGFGGISSPGMSTARMRYRMPRHFRGVIGLELGALVPASNGRVRRIAPPFGVYQFRWWPDDSVLRSRHVSKQRKSSRRAPCVVSNARQAETRLVTRIVWD